MIRDKGLRQGWLAHKIDMDDSTFSLIVGGKKALPYHKVDQLAALLGVAPDEILHLATKVEPK